MSARITIPFNFAKKHQVLLINVDQEAAHIIYPKQPDVMVLDELRRFISRPLKGKAVSEESFAEQLVKMYEIETRVAVQMAEDLGDAMSLQTLMQELPVTEDLLEKQDEAPIIRLLNALLSEAIKENASDIHIEPFEDKVSVRLRVDGLLREVLSPSRLLAPLIVSRIKVMAKLDIAEKRLPQDGRTTLRIAGRAVDVRVSTMPTNHGERVVLRLLDKKNARLDLAHLGMNPETLVLMKKLIQIPHGIILVTGPTGSGKTTTLYAALSNLNQTEQNILTIEDPIEYDLAGIGQTQVNYRANMTFAKGLRAILRQDPDIVMVGEIRDLETTQIAIQASLTGHLVLSTLHTNTAIGAITRLTDMGAAPFLLASSLIGVIAQRLIRLLCNHCKKPYLASDSECKLLMVESPQTLYQPVGCEHCRQSGYSGRSGIYEIIEIDQTFRSLIHDQANERILKEHARQYYPSIRQDGLKRVLQGNTTLDEILRVTNEE